MTRQEVQQILMKPFYERCSKGSTILEWEHCAKKFYSIPNELALEHLMGMAENFSKEDDDPMILKCEYKNDTYYFGIGLDDCENLSLQQIRELYKYATWSVYTWAD